MGTEDIDVRIKRTNHEKQYLLYLALKGTAHNSMKKIFWITLITLFTLAAASLMVVQYVQMKRTITVSDNLFNISVNNAMDDMIEQLNRLKVEDYIDQNDRYRLLKFKRVEELNNRMQNVVKENYTTFYDTTKVEVGITMIDSVKLLPHVKVTSADSNAIAQYNTLLATRDKIMNSNDFFNRFVSDISEYVVDNIMTSSNFNFYLLDSLITDKLMVNGVDIAPYIGIYDYTDDKFIYSNDEGKENKLRESPFKYRFHPDGMMSPNEYFIVLQFPLSSLMLKENSTRYFLLSFFLISLILILFYLSIRAIFRKEKLDEMKNDFINNMTHEIKTPIATIGLACEMLQDPTIGNDPATNSTYIGIIGDENRRMRMLVETILQSSKMSSKNFQLNLKEIDFNSIIESVIANFRPQIESRGGVIKSDYKCNLPVIIGDELHLTNMVYNLIDNAIKYSPERLEIEVLTDKTDSNIIFSVSDHGLGINKEDQKHIFERFYRVSTGNVHDVKGFGIGLSYVHQVVMLHKGTITVDSTPGEGTTFTINLPIE